LDVLQKQKTLNLAPYRDRTKHFLTAYMESNVIVTFADCYFALYSSKV